MLRTVEVPQDPTAIAEGIGVKLSELSVFSLVLAGHLGQSAAEGRAALLDAVAEVFDNTVRIVAEGSALQVSNDV